MAWVLGQLQTKYGLAVWFDLEGRVYACEPYKVVGDAVEIVEELLAQLEC